jgi:hypothetical protein
MRRRRVAVAIAVTAIAMAVVDAAPTLANATATADAGAGSDVQRSITTNAVATATVTDCPEVGPTGMHCTGFVITAARSAVAGRGGTDVAVHISVEVYDVELLDDLGFVPTLVETGQSDHARLRARRPLQHVAVRARVDVCPLADGAPVPSCDTPRTLALSVEWTGSGEITTQHVDDETTIDGCTYRTRGKASSRPATITATVDGASVRDPALPQFPQTLRLDRLRHRVACVQPS